MLLTLDFETNGLEWFKYGKEGSDFRVLCAAYKVNDAPATTTEDMSLVKELVEQSDVVVMHNAQFDTGILHVLGIDYKKPLLVDTLILSKLHHNSLLLHNLDYLSKRYLNDQKDNALLVEAVKEVGLLKSKAQSAEKVAKENMGVLYEHRKDVVCTYAIKDVELTYRLYKEIFYTTDQDPNYHSDLIKAMTQAQARGVRVDAKLARKFKKYYEAKVEEVEPEIRKYLGDIKLSSPPQLLAKLLELGYKPPKETKKRKDGTRYTSYTTSSEWLSTLDDPMAKALILWRKYNNLLSTFLNPAVKQAAGEDYTVIHPYVNIYGASETGRATSNNPNIQNIPSAKDDEAVGAEIRKMYLPFEGDTWYSIDFSGQESRLQVHYGSILKIRGADILVSGYNTDPDFDLHKKVAEIAGIDRKSAKSLNFGISYGMQEDRLKKSLKVDSYNASLILERYYKEMPFLPTLVAMIEKKASIFKRIKTLGKRILWCDYPGATRKAFNKLIQGGSADQTWICLVELYRQGIPFLFPVHDEINYSLKCPKMAERAKDIMETSVKLAVPTKSEMSCGRTWGDCK